MQLSHHDRLAPTEHGTLLWIGNRRSPYFTDAYQFCDRRVAQLAFRETLDEAISRPASAVKAILWCRENDSLRHAPLLDVIRNRHRDAEMALLSGPLVAGQRPHPRTRLSVDAIDWCHWNAFLPEFLSRCGGVPTQATRLNLVAVVAEVYQNAACLQDILEAAGIASIWCRRDQLSMVRRVDEIWWDDSSTEGQTWDSLFAKMQGRCEHQLWITSWLTAVTKTVATQAGIQTIVTKPGGYSELIDRIAGATVHVQREAA
jgi:hypothetical protein